MRADRGKAPTPSLAEASPGDAEINARRIHVHFDEISAPLCLSLSFSLSLSLSLVLFL